MRAGPIPHSSIIFIRTVYLTRINNSIIMKKYFNQFHKFMKSGRINKVYKLCIPQEEKQSKTNPA